MRNVLHIPAHRFWLFLLPVLFLGLPLAAEEFTLRAEPQDLTASVGTPFRITVHFNSMLSEKLQLPALKNARWLHNITSQSVRIVNGVPAYSRTYTLLPEKEGELLIPPIRGRSGGQRAATDPMVIQVKTGYQDSSTRISSRSSGELMLKDLLFGRIVLPEKQKKAYCGEEIPGVLELYILRQFTPRVRIREFPVLSGLKNAVITDTSAEYSDPRRASRQFSPPKEVLRRENGRIYTVLRFPFSFRVLKPGEITLKATLKAGVVQPRGSGNFSPFDDDFLENFFSSGFSSVQDVNVPFTGEARLAVQQPPAPPAGVPGTGLAGSWRFTTRLSRSSAKVGEPLELLISGRGKDSPELAEAPPLSLPGFRVYPPETVRKKGLVEFKYALIPLASGEKKFTVRFCWFDPAQGAYQQSRTDFTLPVAPGEKSAAPMPQEPLRNGTVAENARPSAPDNAPREELFYQKSAPGNFVLLPLWRNQAPAVLALLAAGLLIAGTAEYAARRRDALSAHPELLGRRRRRALLGPMKRDLLRAGEPAEFLRREVLPHLAEALGLDPGATAGEAAEQLDDPELKELFNQLEATSFLPGNSGKVTVSPRQADKLFRLMKKLSLFFCIAALALPFSLSGAGLNAEFDAGNYAAARTHYRSLQGKDRLSAALCYNLGGVCCRMDDLPGARLYFTRALLLAPGDSEIRENLNFVNRKLLQSEVGSADTPAALLLFCRDCFRPDQYMVLAAAAVFVLLVTAGFRRRLSFGWKCGISAGAGVLLFLALAAIAFQAAGPYSADRAILQGKNVELRTLPADGSGHVEATLPGGGDARIIETRDCWVRVRTGGRDGWVKAEQAQAVFPYGIF